MIYAVKGGGCFWNGRRCHVSEVSDLKEAVLLTSGLHYFGPKQEAWDRLIKSTYIQRTWGDAYGYLLVATGRADVMIDPIVNLWDVAPIQPIIEEAGGRVCDWKGVATVHSGESIATNEHLAEAVLAMMGGSEPRH